MLDKCAERCIPVGKGPGFREDAPVKDLVMRKLKSNAGNALSYADHP